MGVKIMKYDEIVKIRDRIFKWEPQSADFLDAMDNLGMHDQCLHLDIKPFYNHMVVCGPAFTYFGTREPLYDEDFPVPAVDNFAQFEAMYPGCVVVLNPEHDQIVGHMGELMSWGAHNQGAVGAVIDGGSRDKKNIEKIPNWGMFARYASPIESKRRWRPRAIQEPIFMSGATHNYVRVNPGDWIFGDCDGVAVIPQEALMDVIAETERQSLAEMATRKALMSGAPFGKTMIENGRV